MVTDQMKVAAQSVDVVTLAESFGAVLHRHGQQGEYAGPCPCRGCTALHDGFHVRADRKRWLCHTCNPTGWHDSIELVSRCKDLRYPDAVRFLLGEFDAFPPTTKVVQPAQPEQQFVSWDAARAADNLAGFQDDLWSDSALAERGRQYLEARGLEDFSWLNFRLGVANVKTGRGNYAPAITILWYVRGELVDVAFRFVEPQGRQRYKRWGTPANRLFGNHANLEAADTLVLCEGELNAMSVWQVAHYTGVHVLSTGTQTIALSDKAVQAVASRYSTVIVWADEKEVSEALQRQLVGQVKGVVGAMYSPSQGGVKLDANSLLQQGMLGEVLSQYRESILKSQPQLEHLHGQLLTGAMVMQGLDVGTAGVLKSVSQRLGRTCSVWEPESGRWIVNK